MGPLVDASPQILFYRRQENEAKHVDRIPIRNLVSWEHVGPKAFSVGTTGANVESLHPLSERLSQSLLANGCQNRDCVCVITI